MKNYHYRWQSAGIFGFVDIFKRAYMKTTITVGNQLKIVLTGCRSRLARNLVPR